MVIYCYSVNINIALACVYMRACVIQLNRCQFTQNVFTGIQESVTLCLLVGVNSG